MKAQDIIIDSLKEIQVISQGEVPSAAILADGLTRLNRMYDRWAARKILAFNVGFQLFSLQANLNPHTIGPTGTFPVPQRPIRVESASFLLPGPSGPVDTPINIRDDAWWAGQSVKSMTSSVVTDLYYSPDFPNGTLNFWPIPTVSNQVRLELWGLLGNYPSPQTAFSMPPGYWDATVLNLALLMAPSFGAAAQVSELLISNAKQALTAVESNNSPSPRCASSDAGMPNKGRGGARADFNWASGMPV